MFVIEPANPCPDSTGGSGQQSRYIFEEIKIKYLELNPHSTIEISLGASGALTQQIIHGAPFDFFMAADASFPKKLQDEGCTVGAIKTYGFGKLVLWSN